MLLTSWLRSLPALMVRGSRRGLFRRMPQARALLGQRSHWGGAHVSAHAGGLRFNEGAEWLEDRALLATITVTSLEDNTTSDGAVTLREAIQAAQTDSAVDGSTAGSGADTIEFAPALFTSGDATITLTLFDTGLDNGEVGPTALKITSNLTITGPSGNNGLTIARDTDDTNKFRLFHVTTASTLTLANLTLSGGLAKGGDSDFGGGGAGMGGAVFNQGSLTLLQSTLSGNTAQGGGSNGSSAAGGGGLGADGQAIFGGGPNGGSSTANGGFGGGGRRATTTNRGGDAGFGGGGGFSGSFANPSGYESNYGGRGGFGGGAGAGDPVLLGNTPAQRPGFGGGVTANGGNAGGGAGMGGAIFNLSGTVNITNSTLAANSAVGGDALGGDGQGLGGAVFTRNGTVTVLNSTLSGNTADQSGGGALVAVSDGIARSGYTGGFAAVSISNSILANSANGGTDLIVFDINTRQSTFTGAGNLIESKSTSVSAAVDQALTDSIVSTADPLLGALADNGGPTKTFALQSGSPAIDAGNNAAASGLTTDQRGTGFDRVFNTTVDLGAFEVSGPTNAAPTVANAIPDQNATEDSAFSFQFAADAFNDADVGDSLTYSTGTLPSWLSFTPATRTFSGTPANADVGNIDVTVTATDGSNAMISDTFQITVVNTNDAPTVANAIPDQNATEETAFTFQFSATAFNDVDAGDSLTYSTGTLPSWLTFTPATRTFSGTPANADLGNFDVTVTATDGSSAMISDTFQITVAKTNHAPTVANAIPDQNATEDSAFTFQFSATAFNDVDAGDSLTYTATKTDDSALPTWLSFEASTRTFSGTPANADVGNVDVKVTATDNANASVSDTFTLTVANTNDAPTVATAIPDQNATEDSAFTFQFSATAFNDVDAGDSLTYSTGTVPSWLTFTPVTRTFSGTPANADVGRFNVTVTATDGSSAMVSDTFQITVANTNDAPTVANTIADQIAPEGAVFSFTFAANTFDDVDVGDSLTYSTSSLPSWLRFNAGTRTFSGTPQVADVGTVSIQVTATDTSSASISDTFDLVVMRAAFEYGDAPALYPTTLADNGARHVASGPTLGLNRDGDRDGAPSALADGDDNNGDVDDEDGITFRSTIVADASVMTRASIEVDLQNADEDGNFLDGFLDLNGDGDWTDEGEHIIDSVNLGTTDGLVVVTFTIPVDTGDNVIEGDTFARFRLSTSGGLSSTGLATDGEVEDYAVAIVQSSEFTDAVVDTPTGGGELCVEIVDGNVVVRRGEEVLLVTPVEELETLTINGSDETDDTLALDFTDGNPIPTGLLNFNGGSGGNDIITITGGEVETATYTFENLTDGTIEYDLGDERILIDYTGLEPVIDNMQAVNRIFDFTGGSELIVLLDSNGADGRMTITSTLGESIEFINPTGSLTINGGSGNDTITITSLDAAFALLIDINGDDGNDIIALGNGVVVGDITGGADTDSLDYSAFTTSVTVNIATGTATNTLSIATIENAAGGSGADLLTGNSSNNALSGNGGNDTISGGSGNDLLDGGADEDQLVESVTGSSTLTATSLTGKVGGGTDTHSNFEFASLTGSAGNDTINAATFGGDVTLLGGNGKDSLTGGSGDDILDGGLGNDTLKSGAGDDELSGGEGTDSIDGGSGIDCLLETVTGNITITNTKITGLGSDKIINVECFEFSGDERDNLLDASKYTLGAVVLRGLGGNDTLLGGSRNDTLDGGSGVDTIRQSAAANQTLTNTQVTGLGTDMLLSIEEGHLIGSGRVGLRLDSSAFTGKVTLEGASGRDTLLAGSGNSTLRGNAGNDLLVGGSRADSLDGGSGNDTAFGNEGNDTIRGGAGNDRLEGNSSDDQLFGDEGNDRIFGGDGQDLINGGAGNDTILGEAGHDTLNGGAGSDAISGGNGDDLIDGDVGNDTVLGGSGNDTLRNAGGADLLSGGSGNDRFIASGSRITLGGGDDTVVGSKNTIDAVFTFDFDKLLLL